MNPRVFVPAVALLVLSAPAVSHNRMSADEPGRVVSTILFTSNRDNPTAVPPITGGEIYAIDVVDGSFSAPRRLMPTNAYSDIFPALAPDGSGRIVFDSNRLRQDADPINRSDLFLTNHDGTSPPVFLTRGGSPTWSPERGHRKGSRWIAFHASASGAGLPINPFPGSATTDSDIFVVNVDHLFKHGAAPRNITPNRTDTVDDDPSWSPDGQIAFTSYVNDPTSTVTGSEIFVMTPRGGKQVQLTSDGVEKRGAAWSPDGQRLLFACRLGGPGANGIATFEICVMDAVVDAPVTRLTFNTVQDLTPSWSPDGGQIVFHRAPANQLWTMRVDGSEQTQLTAPPGLNLLATSWGVIAPLRKP